MLRTAADLLEVVKKNPFAKRSGIEPGKLLVNFLAYDPGKEAREKALAIKIGPEEMHLIGREAYIYFPNGQGPRGGPPRPRPKGNRKKKGGERGEKVGPPCGGFPPPPAPRPPGPPQK